MNGKERGYGYMETLVIDRKMLPERILSYIDTNRNVRVKRDADNIVFTPASEIEEFDDNEDTVNPEGIYVNPDDYPDTTAYLNAIPGMAEMLIKSKNLSPDNFEEWV